MNKYLLFFCGLLVVQVQALNAQNVPRTILALYDGAHVTDPRLSVIHRLAEMPLNHLGIVVRYHDINEPLPSPDSIPEVRGVLVWEAARITEPGNFITWAGEILDSGKRLVMIGGFGNENELEQSAHETAIEKFWMKLGIRSGNEWVPFTYKSKIVFRDPRLVDFERRVGGVLPGYERLSVVDGQGYSCLKVRREGDSATDSDLVVITRKGGWVASGYAYFHNESTDTVQWYINPFEFFRRALATDELPKPDITTLAGKRIFFSHIDGDGWNNLTEIHPYRNRGVLSSEIVKREIIEAYPDLPVTVAPIAGDLDPAWHGSPKSLQVARDILALPQVEAGSHTYSHPFDWNFFADGNPDKERPFLKFYARPWSGEKETEKRNKTATVYYKKSGYVKPRAYAVRPFDLKLEIEGAIGFINTLLPPEKKVQVFQWSGDTNPFPEAIAITHRQGVRNINGGDTRLDRKYPSYGWVSPIGQVTGGELQIYASNSNENIYTDQWSEQFFGYRHLIRTLDNTETPIRIKPAGVYYHMYSGQKLSSLNAVRANLEYVRGRSIIPVTTSHYAAIAEGFYTTQIERTGERQWRIHNRQALQTLRFDRALFSAVDFRRSRGVLGQHHYQGSLYISLDKSVSDAVIALREYGGSDRPPPSSFPYLSSSNWQVWQMQRKSGTFSFLARGFGEGRMIWQVPQAGRYRITITGGNGDSLHRTADVSDNETLKFSIGSGLSRQTVEIRVDYLRENI